MELWKNLLEIKPERNAENPSWLWSLLACHLGTVRTVRLFSLANHSWCPRRRSASSWSAAVLSLRWIVLSSRLLLRPLAGDRSSSRWPSTTGPSATAAHAFGPSSRDFRPPLHACLGHLFFEMIASDDDDYPNPRVAFRVSESVSVPCRRSCFVSVRFYRLCSCGFLDGFVRWDGKRKAQFLEALFRAFLVEASRLKVKGRPAR